MRKNSNVNNPTYKECKFSFNKSLPLLKTVLISNTRYLWIFNLFTVTTYGYYTWTHKFIILIINELII